MSAKINDKKPVASLAEALEGLGEKFSFSKWQNVFRQVKENTLFECVCKAMMVVAIEQGKSFFSGGASLKDQPSLEFLQKSFKSPQLRIFSTVYNSDDNIAFISWIDDYNFIQYIDGQLDVASFNDIKEALTKLGE